MLARETNFFRAIKLTQLEIHNVQQISAGGFSAAITDQNQLIVWGSGAFGNFATPQKVCMDGVEFKSIEISCAEQAFAAAIDTKGGLYCWGFN